MGQNEEIKNMSELKPRITENGIDYILVGDYYIPDLKLPEEHPNTAHRPRKTAARMVSSPDVSVR